jgi:hypothetical protein
MDHSGQQPLRLFGVMFTACLHWARTSCVRTSLLRIAARYLAVRWESDSQGCHWPVVK